MFKVSFARITQRITKNAANTYLHGSTEWESLGKNLGIYVLSKGFRLKFEKYEWISSTNLV